MIGRTFKYGGIVYTVISEYGERDELLLTVTAVAKCSNDTVRILNVQHWRWATNPEVRYNEVTVNKSVLETILAVLVGPTPTYYELVSSERSR